MAFLHESQVAQGGSGGFSYGFINFVKGFVEFILILLCEEVHGFLNVLVLPFDVDLPFFACTIIWFFVIFTKKAFQHLGPHLKASNTMFYTYL